MKKTAALFLVISLILVACFSIYIVNATYSEKNDIGISRYTEYAREYIDASPTTPNIDANKTYSFGKTE